MLLVGVLQAKKKKIESIDAASMGVDLEPRLEILSVAEPSERAAGIIVADVDELVDKLKNEAAVL